MSARSYVFSSESVSAGHPDKVCDQISDYIVDRYLQQDPNARVAVEAMATTNRVMLAGETRSNASITRADLEQYVREAIRVIGYEQPAFHWNSVDVDVFVHEQSADIAQGVDQGTGVREASMGQLSRNRNGEVSLADAPLGAGDQGIMFGYACNETDAYMPAPVYYAHRLMESLYRAWRSGDEPLLGPDAKSQLTLRYRDSMPVHVDAVVASTQHVEDASLEDIRSRVTEHLYAQLPAAWMTSETKLLVNPTGRFVIGGPDGDAGLTGRKIIVDTYGGAAPHGGGAFSGKDSSKVDRSATYAMRWLAKNIVAAGVARSCLVQVAYAIGVAEPVSLYVKLGANAQCSPESVERAISEIVDLTPSAIRQRLQLHRPMYFRTASFGHFGREFDEETGAFSWERLDLVDDFRHALGLQ